MIPTIAGSDWFDFHRPRLLSGSLADRLAAYCIDKLYLLLSSGTSIVASTKEILWFMNRVYGVRPKHLALVPNAIVDFSFFGNGITRNDSRKPNTILFVGRLSRENGVEVLVRSMRLVVQSVADAKLVVVGDGPLRSELVGLTDKLGLDRNVEIVGAVSRHEVPKHMRAATVAVFPFIWRAGAGIAVYEAMAMGLPIVISVVNDTIRELVESRCVMGTPAQDEVALSEGILRFLNDSGLRETYCMNALRYVRENLSPDSVASVWETAVHRARELASSRCRASSIPHPSS
jgi:glycosyltransferase involved in cell wall biosynthesis